MRHRVANWTWREALLAAGLVLVLAAGLALTLAARAESAQAIAVDNVVVLRGEAIFRRERCFFCHSLDGSPTQDPNLTQSGPDLAAEGGRRADDWHRAHLVNPGAVVAGSAMPAFASLPGSDVEALVAFLQAQGVPASAAAAPANLPPGEPVPAVAATLENYRAGRDLYTANCAGCHAAGGNGAGAVGHLLQPEPRDFTDADWMAKQSDQRLFEVISNGLPQTAMPGYRDTLSALERAQLAAYIRYFSDASERQWMEQGFAP